MIRICNSYSRRNGEVYEVEQQQQQDDSGGLALRLKALALNAGIDPSTGTNNKIMIYPNGGRNG